MESLEFLKLFDEGHQFSEYELDKICGKFSVKDLEEESGRWTTSMTSILKIGNRTFLLYWEKGNTEYQENEFFEQPFEVKVVERTRTVEQKLKSYVSLKNPEVVIDDVISEELI